MKVFLKRTLLVLLILFAVAWVYAAAVSIPAKKHTKQLFEQLLQSDIIELQLSDFNRVQMHQLLRVEDPDFYNHKGVDSKTPGAGLTTITQALAKQFYFKKFKPGWAKVKQSLIAWLAIHPLVSKDEQLLVFINSVYLGEFNGEPVYGFSQAAQSYYGLDFSELNDDQYLALLAMIIAPNKVHVLDQHQENQIRVERIRKMLRGEYQLQGLRDVWYDK